MADSVASRYAEALFSLSVDEKETDAWEKQLESVKEIWEKAPEAGRFFASVIVPKQEKLTLLEEMFADKDREVVNFLKIVIQNGRSGILDEILSSYHRMYLDSRGLAEGVIRTPYPLDEDEVKALEEAVSRKIGKTVSLKQVNDPDLISGVRIEVEGKVIDSSMKYRLAKLKQTILEP